MTLDERKSKLRLAAPLQSKKAQPVKQAAIDLLHPIKRFVETITFDNGKEFSLHEAIARALDCETYFARPYHSSGRGDRMRMPMAYYANIFPRPWNRSMSP